MSATAIYWMIFIGIAIASWLVQWNLNRKTEKYSQMLSFRGLTGKDVAEMMLRANGITDVKVISTAGRLTDHYNPADQTVNLSEIVYGSNSIMAVAVAAHECGHAIQHAHAYGPLTLRSKLVPVVSFASQWMQWLLLGGMLMLSYTGSGTVLLIGVILFSMTTLFSFITLPVEIDASRRAIKWLDSAGLTDTRTHAAAVDALRSAAYTYVVAALGSLATLLYYVMLLAGSRRND
ncbi:MAG: zinc metallopeptidase [Bacteroides sp.]|nr:zinc metallopeptidase [Bacteroides sp.]MCM1420736.1 zinc metallopeptidase [Bacteroides sp.]